MTLWKKAKGNPSFDLSQLCFVLAILAASFFLRASEAHADSEGHPQEIRHAKQVILFIGDGMHLAHEVAASRYLFGRDAGLVFHGFPYRGNVTTWDVTTYNYWARRRGAPEFQADLFRPWLGYDIVRGGILPYPLQTSGMDAEYLTASASDSASAATAWATGQKTDDGNIAWRSGAPPDGALTTIAELLRSEKGYAIGLVSTVPFSHATPAAHASHNRDRNDFVGIAGEIIHTFQPDVIVGGGHPQWTGKFKYLSESDYLALKRDGAGGVYEFVERQAGADGAAALLAAVKRAAANKKKVFGLFGGQAAAFESPQPQAQPGAPEVVRATDENPLLKDCVTAALLLLSREERGFFAMFEQGDIDWANHDNDYQRMIGTMWDLDSAVRAAVAFIEQPNDAIDWSNTLLIVAADHANGLMRFEKHLGRGELPYQIDAKGLPCRTLYCGRYTYPRGEVRYSTSRHTNELVRIYAKGSGSHLFEKYEGTWYPGARLIDNTQIFEVIGEATGIRPSGISSLEHFPQVDEVASIEAEGFKK